MAASALCGSSLVDADAEVSQGSSSTKPLPSSSGSLFDLIKSYSADHLPQPHALFRSVLEAALSHDSEVSITNDVTTCDPRCVDALLILCKDMYAVILALESSSRQALQTLNETAASDATASSVLECIHRIRRASSSATPETSQHVSAASRRTSVFEEASRSTTSRTQHPLALHVNVPEVGFDLGTSAAPGIPGSPQLHGVGFNGSTASDYCQLASAGGSITGYPFAAHVQHAAPNNGVQFHRSTTSQYGSPKLIPLAATASTNSEATQGAAQQLVSMYLPRVDRAQLMEEGGFEIVNDYLLVEELGRGASGAVYLGVHEKTGQTVAIKALRKMTHHPVLPPRHQFHGHEHYHRRSLENEDTPLNGDDSLTGDTDSSRATTSSTTISSSSSSSDGNGSPRPYHKRNAVAKGHVRASMPSHAAQQHSSEDTDADVPAREEAVTERRNSRRRTTGTNKCSGQGTAAAARRSRQASCSAPPPSPIEREIWIMKHIKHPNLVQLLQVIDDAEDQMIYLVLEYCPKGSLSKGFHGAAQTRPSPKIWTAAKALGVNVADVLTELPPSIHERSLEATMKGNAQGASTPPLQCICPSLNTSPLPLPQGETSRSEARKGLVRPIAQMMKFVGQVCSGLKYLHLCNIIHRDIKPDNILLADDDTVKISDFGVSGRLCSSRIDLFHAAGTPAFMAPEVLENSDAASKASDVWSFGVTLYVMMFGELPFKGDTLRDKMHSIMNDEVPFPATFRDVPEGEGLDEATFADWCDVVRQMLRKDPAQRITLKQFSNHPFMAQVSKLSNRESTRQYHDATQPTQQREGTTPPRWKNRPSPSGSNAPLTISRSAQRATPNTGHLHFASVASSNLLVPHEPTTEAPGRHGSTLHNVHNGSQHRETLVYYHNHHNHNPVVGVGSLTHPGVGAASLTDGGRAGGEETSENSRGPTPSSHVLAGAAAHALLAHPHPLALHSVGRPLPGSFSASSHRLADDDSDGSDGSLGSPSSSSRQQQQKHSHAASSSSPQLVVSRGPQRLVFVSDQKRRAVADAKHEHHQNNSKQSAEQ